MWQKYNTLKSKKIFSAIHKQILTYSGKPGNLKKNFQQQMKTLGFGKSRMGKIRNEYTRTKIKAKIMIIHK